MKGVGLWGCGVGTSTGTDGAGAGAGTGSGAVGAGSGSSLSSMESRLVSRFLFLFLMHDRVLHQQIQIKVIKRKRHIPTNPAVTNIYGRGNSCHSGRRGKHGSQSDVAPLNMTDTGVSVVT